MVNDCPIEVCEATSLFVSETVEQHSMASLIRMDSGRLVLSFRRGLGPTRTNDGVLCVSRSDDDGQSFSRPSTVYSYPNWDCLNLGGLMRFADNRIVLGMGRMQMDQSLPGEEPCTAWYMTTTVSDDGALSWSKPGPEIRLFPEWTELYGASNPHQLTNGQFMLAVIGTQARDTGWQAGVTFTSDGGETFSPPIIVAQADGIGFGDMDLVRLPDQRFLAVARAFGGHSSVSSYSGDEGQTWTPIQSTNFCGANINLTLLKSGAILCSYRDEGKERAGVSCSLSEDAGESWRFVGQLSASPTITTRMPGAQCGYPDIVQIGPETMGCVLHPYPDNEGRINLHWLELRDRT